MTFDQWWEDYFERVGKDRAWLVKAACREAFSAAQPAAPAVVEAGKALRKMFEMLMDAADMDAEETAINATADGKQIVHITVAEIFKRWDDALAAAPTPPEGPHP